MITTPEQMREAAIAACKNVADEAKRHGIPQMTMGANICADAIRAIPITPQPADPLSDPRVVALVEALALAQYGLSWASAYFRDSNPPYCVDPCPPVNRGLDATRAALRAIGGEA